MTGSGKNLSLCIMQKQGIMKEKAKAGEMLKPILPILLQPGTGQYFWVRDILDGIQECLVRLDGEYMVIDSQPVRDGSIPKDVPVVVSGHLSRWLSGTADLLRSEGYTPIVVNAGIAEEEPSKYTGVFFDMASGMREIVGHCAARGCEQIALFGVRKNVSSDLEKIRFFRRETAALGLAEPKIHPLEGPLESCIGDFLAAFFDDPADAVVCANDTAAVLLIREMRRSGIRIPKDVLVVGIGDSAVGRLMSDPPVSLRIDYRELGRQTVWLWRHLSRGRSDAVITVTLPCRLNTAGPLRQEQPLLQEISALPDGDDLFYEDQTVRRLFRLETLLREADETDLKLLAALQRREPDEAVAEQVWLSARAVRYRINKMMKKLGAANRGEIIDLLNEFEVRMCGND